MFCKGCLFYILAFASLTYAVKVNMHGSLSLGKEVMDTISHYLLSGYSFNGRRSMTANLDLIPIEVNSASLCKKVNFCQGKLEKFVNEYVTSLAQAVDAVFDGIFNENAVANLEMTKSIFGKLKGSLRDVRKILKTANEKITEEKEAYLWVGVVKKICALFQRKSITYIIDRLDADKNLNEVKKKLTQKLIINIAATEAKAERDLCYEHHICLRTLECTKALNTMLESLKKLPDDKIKVFMKAFYEALPDTTFYSRLNEVTANELQVILNDMAYFENVPTKDILTSIQQTVENRINVIDSNAEVKKGHDILLVHSILSDLDYIYSKQRSYPFHGFIDHFLVWAKAGGRITSQIKEVIRSLQTNINFATDSIFVKLIGEVRVFLEITVDP